MGCTVSHQQGEFHARAIPLLGGNSFFKGWDTLHHDRYPDIYTRNHEQSQHHSATPTWQGLLLRSR